jgi:DNA-binding transcriptional regulator YdaS (Cro superfamily)
MDTPPLLALIKASEASSPALTSMPLATADDTSQSDETMRLTLRAAVKAAGSQRALAHMIGVTHAAVAQWDRAPAKRVVDIERATGIPRERLRPDLYSQPTLPEVIKILRAAGYHVSKPRPPKKFKRGKDRVGPTFVAEFADGAVTRMSTFTSLKKLDWERGKHLSVAAWQSRWRMRHAQHDELSDKRYGGHCLVNVIAPVPPAIISMHFEQDGKVLEVRP